MADKEPQQPEELPIVLVHRLPSYTIPLDPSFRDQLRSQFHMLDPHESPEPYDSFLARHATFIRVLMTIGHSPISRRVSGATACFGADSGNNRGIVVTNASLAFAEDVADCTVGLLIDVLRRISAADRFVCGRMWPVKENYPLGFKLGGKRVGIGGLGSIGSEVAKRLLAIAYTSRNKKQSVSFPFYANVRDLGANSDVLVLCCALTKETYHMINKDVMVALGKDGVIINPNVPKELFGLDNVVSSPHCPLMTAESFEALDQLIVVNLKAFFSNKLLVSVVSNE
ncbi:hypothetical protein V6Z11_A03G022600 [Gossypium hirsutum]